MVCDLLSGGGNPCVKPKAFSVNVSPRCIADDLLDGTPDPAFVQMGLYCFTHGDAFLASSLGPNRGGL